MISANIQSKSIVHIFTNTPHFTKINQGIQLSILNCKPQSLINLSEIMFCAVFQKFSFLHSLCIFWLSCYNSLTKCVLFQRCNGHWPHDPMTQIAVSSSLVCWEQSQGMTSRSCQGLCLQCACHNSSNFGAPE